MRAARKYRWMLVVATLLVPYALATAAAPAARPSNLTFSHSLHVVDQEIGCATCHGTVASSTRADDRNVPSMDVCADCHDVGDDETCGMCHQSVDDIITLPAARLSVQFSHKRHLDQAAQCKACHGAISTDGKGSSEPVMPDKPLCMSCHNSDRAPSTCNLCHAGKVNLIDIHPAGWRHKHAAQAASKPEWCTTCHRQEVFCVACHRGDNQTGSIHDLNYEFTHGLDAQGKEADCARCHDRRAFCNDCHQRENRTPLGHSTLVWRTEHGQAARRDVENCASCHQADDPTCARAGCHRDADGIRGTDARIHSSDPGRFDTHGPWHSDGGYFCSTCHTDTGRPGVGFCGYCHGGGGQ